MTSTSQAAYTVLFYLLAASSVLLAIAVANAPRLLRAAVYLMGVLMVSAGLYVMLGAEFLAGIQVLVYVGGIVVLIVFAIMLTRSSELQIDDPPPRRKFLAALASLAFLLLTCSALWSTPFPALRAEDASGKRLDDAKEIGMKLLDQGSNGYVLPFEIISLLLLTAVIGGIVVARKTPPRNQPFTSGGDRPGEADFQLPRSQREGGEGILPSRLAGASPAESLAQGPATETATATETTEETAWGQDVPATQGRDGPAAHGQDARATGGH